MKNIDSINEYANKLRQGDNNAAILLYSSLYKQLFYIAYCCLPVTEKAAQIVLSVFDDSLQQLSSDDNIANDDGFIYILLKQLATKIIIEYRTFRQNPQLVSYSGVKNEFMKLSEAERLVLLVDMNFDLTVEEIGNVTLIKDGAAVKLESARQKLSKSFLFSEISGA